MWCFYFLLMKLLRYENYQVLPTEEAMLVKPIRDLYNADSSPTKEKFMQQMAVLYFLVDPRSSYSDIADEEEKLKKIIEQEGLPKDFEPSKRLKKAMEVYRDITTTTSMKLLNSMRTAITKIGNFLEEVDLTKVDEKGRPVYQLSAITAATDKVPALARKLIEVEKIVAAEIEEAGRVRGGNASLKMFEDGF